MVLLRKVASFKGSCRFVTVQPQLLCRCVAGTRRPLSQFGLWGCLAQTLPSDTSRHADRLKTAQGVPYD
jgi:hypothetical protein